MARVLVIGGAGYVGSSASAWLIDAGHEVWVLDDLSTGHRELVDRLPGLRGFTRARAGDDSVVRPLLERERFDCVMHFAARSLVGESVAQPERYRENNVLQTQALLESMRVAGVRRFIFSSSCAVFGDPGPGVERMHEGLPKNPVNPYGANKLEVERMLDREAREHGLRAIALRYFNAAGAEPGGRVGEWHEPESHLIPRILQAALRGEAVEVFGTDYPTPDGTAVRDYVHVWDLARAHGAAMERLLRARPEGDAGGSFEAFNLGSESGYSVRQVIEACSRAIGQDLRVVERPRRAGDSPRLVADSARAREVLGFLPSGPADRVLEGIIASAWVWEQERGRLARGGPDRGGARAVFLDRDGTINIDPGYISDPAQMQVLPGAGKALGALKRSGYLVVVVSNQSGVGRGLIRPEALSRIHARMVELLRAEDPDARIDRFDLCLHRPDESCACRKPLPKLLLDGASALGIDLARSYMVGDKPIDLAAGRAAGCLGSVLVRTGSGAESEAGLAPGEAAFVADSLTEAARWILSREG